MDPVFTLAQKECVFAWVDRYCTDLRHPVPPAPDPFGEKTPGSLLESAGNETLEPRSDLLLQDRISQSSWLDWRLLLSRKWEMAFCHLPREKPISLF
jgi:hypothetical protein